MSVSENGHQYRPAALNIPVGYHLPAAARVPGAPPVGAIDCGDTPQRQPEPTAWWSKGPAAKKIGEFAAVCLTCRQSLALQ